MLTPGALYCEFGTSSWNERYEPEEFSSINYIKDKFLDTITLFNFKVVEPSPLEMLATLEAKGGASIFDEIYSFRDKGNRNIALRFDLTVGLTRFISQKKGFENACQTCSFCRGMEI